MNLLLREETLQPRSSQSGGNLLGDSNSIERVDYDWYFSIMNCYERLVSHYIACRLIRLTTELTCQREKALMSSISSRIPLFPVSYERLNLISKVW